MKIVCSKLAAFAIATLALVQSLAAESVSGSLLTQLLYVPPGDATSEWVSIYDNAGVIVRNIQVSAYGFYDENIGTYTEMQFYTTLPLGRYSFSFGGYWTEIVTVVRGNPGMYFPLEAFSTAPVPTDPPAPAVGGNLLVKGAIDMEGRLLNMGTNLTDFDLPAFSLMIDAEGSTFRNISSSQSAIWTWETANYGSIMRLTLSSG